MYSKHNQYCCYQSPVYHRNNYKECFVNNERKHTQTPQLNGSADLVERYILYLAKYTDNKDVVITKTQYKNIKKYTNTITFYNFIFHFDNYPYDIHKDNDTIIEMEKFIKTHFEHYNAPPNSILAFYQTEVDGILKYIISRPPIPIPDMPIKVISCDNVNLTTGCKNVKYRSNINKNDGKLECQPAGYPSITNDIEFQWSTKYPAEEIDKLSDTCKSCDSNNKSNCFTAYYKDIDGTHIHPSNMYYHTTTPIPDMPIKVISCDNVGSTTGCQNGKYTTDIKNDGKLECQPAGYPSITNDIEFQWDTNYPAKEIDKLSDTCKNCDSNNKSNCFVAYYNDTSNRSLIHPSDMLTNIPGEATLMPRARRQ